MENNWNSPFGQPAAPASQAVSRSFISGVFSWMGIALAISAITAYVFGTDASYMSYLINTERGGRWKSRRKRPRWTLSCSGC